MNSLSRSFVRSATPSGGSPATATQRCAWMARALYRTDSNDNFSSKITASKPYSNDRKERGYSRNDRNSPPHRVSRWDSGDRDNDRKSSSESAHRWDNRENRPRYNDGVKSSYGSGRPDNRYRDSQGNSDREGRREQRGQREERGSRGRDFGDGGRGKRNDERQGEGEEQRPRKQPAFAPKAPTYERKEPVYPRVGEEFVFGVGPVLAALRAGRRDIHKVYVYEKNTTPNDKMGKQWKALLEEVQKQNLTPIPVAKGTLNMFADNGNHQGCAIDVGALQMLQMNSPPRIKEGAKGPPLWLFLDQITDPMNLGAVLRSAYFFGADGVAVSGSNSCPLTPVVSKASAGAMELMDVHTVGDVVGFMKNCRSAGWRVIGTSTTNQAQPLGAFRLDQPTIVIFGSEGAGMRPAVLRECSDQIGIFPSQNVDSTAMDSLNVSVCAGVVISHFVNSAVLPSE